MEKINLENLSDSQREDLMKQLAKKAAAERAESNKKRKLYEKNREKRIQKTIKGVSKIEKTMSDFKEEIANLMNEQHAELDEFGLIPLKSKGGFSILSDDGNFKITRSRDTDPKWDETAIKGANLIKEFLVKKREAQNDPAVHDMLMSLLQKNEAGDLEYSKVMIFLQHENKFQDPMWQEGLRLLKEGYRVEFKKFGYQFFKKDTEGKFKAISINFSNL